MGLSIAVDVYDERMRFLARYKSKKHAAAALGVAPAEITAWASDARPRKGLFIVMASATDRHRDAARVAKKASVAANRASAARRAANAKNQRDAARAATVALGPGRRPSWMK